MPHPAPRTLWLDERGRLLTRDQTRLPFEDAVIELASAQACAVAIRTMQVRGAPLIGAVAAHGLALALRADPSDAGLAQAHAALLATRPTAVNLRWALDRVAARVRGLAPAARAEAARDEAQRICDEDVACNRAIGEHAAALLAPLAAARSRCSCSPTATPGASPRWPTAPRWRRSTRWPMPACRCTSGSTRPGRATRAPASPPGSWAIAASRTR